MSGSTTGGESVVIKEFLASFGYRVDESSQRKFNDAITGMTKTVEGLGAGLIGMAATISNVVQGAANDLFKLNVALKQVGTTGGGETAAGLTAFARTLREGFGVSAEQTQSFVTNAAHYLQNNFGAKTFVENLVGTQGTLTDKILRLADYYSKANEAQRAVINKSPAGPLLPPDLRQLLIDPKFHEMLKQNQDELAKTGNNMDALTKEAQRNHEAIANLTSTYEDFANSLTKVLPGIDTDLERINKELRAAIPGFSSLVDKFNDYASKNPWLQHTETGAYAVGQLFTAQPQWLQAFEAYFGAKGIGRILGGLARFIGGRVAGVGAAAVAGAGAEAAGAGAAEGGAGLLAALGPVGWTLLGLGAAGAGGYAVYRGLKRDESNDQGGGATPTNKQGFFSWIWSSLIGSAHAEELPDNVKHLSDNVGELNQTMNDLLDQQFPGWRGSQGPGTPGVWGGKADAPGVWTEGFQNVLKAAGLDPTMRKFLSLLAGPESGGAFDIKNGGARFMGFGSFPEGVAPGGTSSAAGAWQDVSGTWHGIEKLTGLHGFDPTTQAKGNAFWAAKVYQIATGRDLEADLAAGGHENQIAGALHGQWPSLTAGNIHHGMMRNPDQFGPARGGVTVQQNNTNNISGVNDPHAAGRELKTIQDHNHAQLVNSFNVALR